MKLVNGNSALGIDDGIGIGSVVRSCAVESRNGFRSISRIGSGIDVVAS